MIKAHDGARDPQRNLQLQTQMETLDNATRAGHVSPKRQTAGSTPILNVRNQRFPRGGASMRGRGFRGVEYWDETVLDSTMVDLNGPTDGVFKMENVQPGTGL